MISVKKGKYLALLLVFGSGIILSVGLSLVMLRSEKDRIKFLFNEAAAHRFKYLEDVTQNMLAALDSFGDFYAASILVERWEFDTFSQGVFNRQPYIFEFRWVQKVADNQRQAFEESVRKEGFPDFNIKELDKNEQFVAAAPRGEYFAINYISFLPTHKFEHSQIMGLDGASIPERWQAMQLARDTGKPASTGEIRHVGEENIQTASRIFLPIYQNGLSHNTPRERKDNLTGFVVLLYRIDELVQLALKDIPRVGVDIAIYDIASGERKLLYFRSSPTRNKPIELALVNQETRQHPDLIWSNSFLVANQKWVVSCTPAPYFLARHKIIFTWLTLVVGLFITFILSFYLKTVISRSKVIEAQVKERTEEVRKAQERYRLLFEFSQDAIMTIAPPEWNFTSANPATVKMFAVKDEKEFISKSPWELSPELQPEGGVSSEKAKRMMDIAMEKGSNFFEWLHKKASGETFMATVLLSRVESEGKVFLQATVRDISEHKKAEEKLSRANKEWLETFNAISDFVFILDKNSAITKVNRAMLELLKLRESDVIGNHCYEIIHKLTSPWPQCPHQKSILDNQPHTEEVNDPAVGFPLLVSTSPILDEKGELAGSVHIAKDISIIKKSENELRLAKDELEVEALSLAKANEGIKALNKELEKKNDELKKIDQLKSDFVSTVSHELRTPLAIMKEGVSLVLDKITGEINEKTQSTLSMVYANINRLNKLINDLLDISKIEAGRAQIKKSLVDINHLTMDTAEKWKLEAGKKKQELLVSTGGDRINIYIDADKIIQVLNNLISNAIKFTPEKGQIKIEVQDKKDEVEIWVTDTGVGIAQEDLLKVFEKFQQFSRPAGAGAKGTGLGLAISKELVVQHEGVINVASKLGAGTKFNFTLPKKDSETIFKEHINASLKEAEGKKSALSLISIRIPEFHSLQKELGVNEAHDLLKDIEKVVNDSLRRKSDTVVRDTGELIILLLGVDKNGADAVKKRIEEIIKKYLVDSRNKLVRRVSFNIGFSAFPQEAKTEDELLIKARGVIQA